ncbi:MAG: acetylxylan esterase, partial [Proteobacteria bacterium]|nr:acetylxylan esterase [Pseudomonadota bacterium]
MRLWMLCAPILALALPATGRQQDHGAANADRQAMLDRLDIVQLRPGADGFDPKAPNAANYDEARAGTPELPQLMRLSDGRPVRNRKDWDRRRR